jgi:hypothetical protein
MKKSSVVHPFFWAAFPILFLFSQNVNEVAFSEILLPTIFTLMSTSLFLLFLNKLLKDSPKAGIIVSLFLLMCFSFAHALWAYQGWPVVNLISGRWLYLLWWGWFIFGAYYFRKTRRELDNLTVVLNVVSCSLVMISLASIGVYKIGTWSSWRNVPKMSRGETVSLDSSQIDVFPDIYYIILDTYASAKTLKEKYNFDNQEFIDYLTNQGFYVASESSSNYHKTSHSLASSLNMEYINYLGEEYGEDFSDFRPVYVLLGDYHVWRVLKSIGYKFIHVGSYWNPTSRNRYADLNINLYPIPEFSMFLYKTTIFYPLGVRLRFLDERLIHWQRVYYKFEKLAETKKIKGPKFVFAHMLIPHGPLVFKENGEFLTEEEFSQRAAREHYINQLIYANKKIGELFDRLLSNEENPPIIVLQSDEGTYPLRYALEGDDFNWGQASPAELREKMGILNAYYLPKVEEGVLYPSITPVNSFRVIFNLYFKADFELLPDENHVYLDERHPYKFINVTDKIK